MGEGTVFSLFVISHLGGGGGSQVQVLGGPRSRSGWGGSQVEVGGPRSRSRWGGSQVEVMGGSQVQVRGGYPVSVKGKIFDTRFGLIHVQTEKKIFCRGTPPPRVKGENC